MKEKRIKIQYRRSLILAAGILLAVFALSGAGVLRGAAAPLLTTPLAGNVLCGEGSAPDYGFNESLRQEHWTVGWQGFVGESTVNQVDAILDSLEADSIAQTMILILPSEKVGNRVNCAVHFLRYMKLGLPSGERKDNGFVFLIVVDRDKIDVHYGVGLGLPALTASGLTNLNRAGEEAYRSGAGLDNALLTLVREYDDYARSKYEPLGNAAQTDSWAQNDYASGEVQTVELPSLPEGPLGAAAVCGLLCLAIVVLFIVIWVLVQLSRLGIRFPSGGGSSWGGSSWTRGGGGGGRMRGGGGSGRSGRGN